MNCNICKYYYGKDEKGHFCRLAGCGVALSDEEVELCRFGVNEETGEPFIQED